MYIQKIIEQSHGSSSLLLNLNLKYKVKYKFIIVFSPREGKWERKLENEKKGPKGVIMMRDELG